MNMIELMCGLVAGAAAGAVLKDKVTGTDNQLENAKRELDSLYKENDKYSRRNKELERQCEDQLSEIQRLQRKLKEVDAGADDKEDEIEDLKASMTKLRKLNEQLTAKLQQYKSACEAQEAEIATLKEKLD